jgi:sulfonate transport system permease protein
VKSFFHTRWSGLALIVLLLVGWELLARSGMVASVAFPSFTRVFQSLWKLAASGEIAKLLLPSLERLFIGYAIALVLGVAFGVLMG